MLSSRGITLVTVMVVVALATATALRFKDEAVPLLIPDRPAVGEYTAATEFSCNLLSEVRFLYPEFNGWRTSTGEGLAVDGRTTCVLDVVSETEEDWGEVVIEKQIYAADTMPPVGATKNPQSIPYVYIVADTNVSDEPLPSSARITFYTDGAVYSVRVSSFTGSDFPVGTFLTEVISSFTIRD